MKAAEETMADDLTTADGTLIGTPVHMGSMDGVTKLIDTIFSGAMDERRSQWQGGRTDLASVLEGIVGY